MKNRIKQCFSKAAACYGDAASVQKKVAFQCAKYCPEGQFKKVLDVGSGVGFLFSELKDRIVFDSYVSLDLVHPMLLEQKKLSVPLLIAADGENIPLQEEQFDLLVSSSAMQWYSNPEESIPESFKMLKRKGRFAVAIFVKGTLCELADISLKTGFGSVKELKDAEFYMGIISGISNIRVSFDRARHEVYFPSVIEFLRNHKRTGAVASSGSISWGKSKYLNFIKEYEKKYGGEQGVRASYEVLFAFGEVF